MKHFSAEELYDIAADVYQRAGFRIDQSIRDGISQWAYWSAEFDEFHSEEEPREQLRAFLAQDMVDMQD